MSEVPVSLHPAKLQWHAVGAILVILLCAALAFGGYALFLTQFVVPYGFVPDELYRLIEKRQLLDHLAQSPSSGQTVIVFGPSTIRESVDATIVQQQLPAGTRVFNIAESDACIRRFMLTVDRLAAVPNCVVVVGFRRIQFRDLPAIAPELWLAYSYAGYINAERRTPDWVIPFLSESEIKALPRGWLGELLACRVFFSRSLEERLRYRARPDLRMEGFARNFTDPWTYSRPSAPAVVAREIEADRRLFESVVADPQAPALRALDVTLRHLHDLKIPVIVVLTAERPEIRSALAPDIEAAVDANVRAVVERNGACFYASDPTRYVAEDFIDHAHMAATGRVKFSNELARVIDECRQRW